MRVESVDTPSLLELRAIVAQRLQAYGTFEDCTAEDQCTILAQACMVIVHLTAGRRGGWSIAHTSGPRPRRYQPGLDQPALLQAMRPGLHRALGDAQALGNRGGFEPLVPERDEFRLGLQGVVLL